MIVLEGAELEFHFPAVDAHAECSLSFQRTLRIPDDNQEYPLPCGFRWHPTTDSAAKWATRSGANWAGIPL